MENIKEYTARKKAELKRYLEETEAKRLLEYGRSKIKTVVIRVGENPASAAYVKGKVKDCEEVGIECEVRHFPETITEQELLMEVAKCNTDSSIDGFIVQLPLPKHISEAKITEAINYKKDIDGFTKQSLVNPATPQGILTYLEDNNFNFVDANAVVIGRSNIVGRPMAKLLLDKSCNVSVIHSKTSNWNKAKALMDANLIVVATGHRNTLTDDDLMLDFATRQLATNPKGCFIVDVGMNKNDEGKLCGDAEGVTVCEKTPVPGGVGLLTRLALLLNIIKLYEINHKA